MSVRRQCNLLGIGRSNFYYKPVLDGGRDLVLMNRIDEIHTRIPFYGSRKIAEVMSKMGYEIGRKKVQTLMRKMGISAIYPGPNTSKRDQEHRVYPYLLKGLQIIRPNQVWSIDITYVRLGQGFVYLVAIIDWYSRYVLSWRLSNSLDTSFCIEALEAGFTHGTPEIFNSDQGCQFTSEAFTGRLLRKGISISMDSKGRALDNIFVERLWRSVKYEDVYIHDYRSVCETYEGLEAYFLFYNKERIHQSLGYLTPESIHYKGSYSQLACG